MSTTEQPQAPPEVESSVSVRQMFDFDRVQTFAALLILCFYFPFGLCLFILRFFIFLHALLVANILPKDSYLRCIVLRSIFFILGIVIQEDNVNLKNFKAQLIISNRISDFDPLVVNMIYPCVFLSASNFPRYICWLFAMAGGPPASHNADIGPVIQKSSVPVVCFPEPSRTNGRVGLFKFETWPFSSDLAAHIVFLESKSIFNVNISPLGATWYTNLFWLFFMPVTFFNIRYLSSTEKGESESLNEYAKRVQHQMASQTNLYASNFDNSDKKEMIKRFKAELVSKNNSHKTENKARPLSVDEMAIKVKEVLPQVPLIAIKADIVLTKNIDDTIERILNGQVKYTQEESKQQAQATNLPNAENRPNKANSESEKLFYCGASAFGKNASDRTKSFQERKEHLFRVARLRYLQKLTNNSN